MLSNRFPLDWNILSNIQGKKKRMIKASLNSSVMHYCVVYWLSKAQRCRYFTTQFTLNKVWQWWSFIRIDFNAISDTLNCRAMTAFAWIHNISKHTYAYIATMENQFNSPSFIHSMWHFVLQCHRRLAYCKMISHWLWMR